ncbi:MAG: inositol monophosphatase family protein [Gammaproteobacteria bacterium]
MEPGIADMVEYYLPVLVSAGDFAREIQPRISGPAAKPGQNAWVQAITDADQSVQTFVEVATLARFPAAGFYGEEQEQSRNARYFPQNAPTMVWLDPINGTFLYKNQRPGWDIILSITHHGRLLAAISYMPVRERFYLAVRGRGALTGDRYARSLGDLTPLATMSGSAVCLTYEAPEALARLRRDWDALDIVNDYDPQRGIDNLNDLFTGRLAAYASSCGDLLDWGAMAFIVTQAGGKASGLDGRDFDGFDNFHQGHQDMLVAATPDLHAALLATLRRQDSKK